MSHSLRYRAAKLRHALEKQKRTDNEHGNDEDIADGSSEPKRARLTGSTARSNGLVVAMGTKTDSSLQKLPGFQSVFGQSLDHWVQQTSTGTEAMYRSMYGDQWLLGKQLDADKLDARQTKANVRNAAEAHETIEGAVRAKQQERDMWRGPKV